MRKLAAMALGLGLVLSGCGKTPPQVTGGNRVSISVRAADAPSTVDVTRAYTPPKKDPATGEVTPESVNWTVGEAGVVSFTFMTRPGSDAVYINGYRITRYDFNGTVSTTPSESRKLDIYVPSGYTCNERISGSLAAYQSCSQFNTDGSLKTDTVPANGLPISTLNLNFAGALVSEVQRTLSGAYSVVDLEFTGYSSNGAPVVFEVKGISSIARRLGN